jgi:hypothetical protein
MPEHAEVTAYGFHASVISCHATNLTVATGISSVEPAMDINRLVQLLRGLPFRQAVWLFPLATALHFGCSDSLLLISAKVTLSHRPPEEIRKLPVDPAGTIIHDLPVTFCRLANLI